MIYYTCNTHALYTPGVGYEINETTKGFELVTYNADGKQLRAIELTNEEHETLEVTVK